MNQEYESAQQWMKRLFDDDAMRSLQQIAGLPDEERRAAMADPGSFLERAGLLPPEGITMAMMERRLDDLGDPGPPPDLEGGVGGGLHPSDPNVLDELGKERTGPLKLPPRPICFHFCLSWAPVVEPLFRPRTICLEICF